MIWACQQKRIPHSFPFPEYHHPDWSMQSVLQPVAGVTSGLSQSWIATVSSAPIYRPKSKSKSLCRFKIKTPFLLQQSSSSGWPQIIISENRSHMALIAAADSATILISIVFYLEFKITHIRLCREESLNSDRIEGRKHKPTWASAAPLGFQPLAVQVFLWLIPILSLGPKAIAIPQSEWTRVTKSDQNIF